MKILGVFFPRTITIIGANDGAAISGTPEGAVTEENACFQTGGALIVIDVDANALIVAPADCSVNQPIVLANTGAEDQAAISGEANGILTECNPTPSPR